MGRARNELAPRNPGAAPLPIGAREKGNQYVELDGDRAFVETWVVGYHMEAPGSPIDHLKLGLRYKDDVIRVGDDWKIVRREAVRQWHTGPFPRPSIGEAPYPRKPHQSRARDTAPGG